jgi:hypothetical protein
MIVSRGKRKLRHAFSRPYELMMTMFSRKSVIRTPLILGLLVGSTLVLWLVYYVGCIPGQTFDATRFIFFDQGSFLYAIGRMFAGEHLYSEFAWQYGPLAIGWYAMFAVIAGNSPVVLVIAAGVATALAWTGLVILAARKVGPWVAWLGGLLGLLPAITLPGLLSRHTGPHGAVEAMLLVGIVWLMAAERPAAIRALCLGLALGAIQLVRFGPHLVAGVVVVLLLSMQIGMDRSVAGRGQRLVHAFALLLLGYGSVVLCFGCWLLARLSPIAAWEQLWPVQMIAHYEEMGVSSRWPRFESWGESYLHYFPAAVGTGLMVFVILRAVKNREPLDRVQCALLFLPLYFAVGCTFLFRTPSNILAHTWTVWPAIALVGEVRFRWGRGLIVIALLPVVAWQMDRWFETWNVEQQWHAEPLRLPNGRQLWFHGSEAIRIGTLARLLEEKPEALAKGARRKLVVLGAGGGVLHFLNADRVGRHWWYLPEFVRPWETARVVKDISQHELLLQYINYQEPVPRSPESQVSLAMPVDPAYGKELVARMELVEWVPGVGYLFRVSHQQNGR